MKITKEETGGLQENKMALSLQLQTTINCTKTIIHRVQNELASSRTLIGLIGKSELDNQQQEKALTYIQSSYNDLLNLCGKYEDLLTLQTEPLYKKSTNLRSLLQTVLSENSQCTKQIQIDIVNQIPVDIEFYIDKEKMRMIFTQIIRNTCHFSGFFTTLTIRAENRTGYDILWFEDNGPGIPADIQDKLFKGPIQSIDTEHNLYLGFGLLICYFITSQHKGIINLNSNEKGTCIQIILPKKSH